MKGSRTDAEVKKGRRERDMLLKSTAASKAQKEEEQIGLKYIVCVFGLTLDDIILDVYISNEFSFTLYVLF